MTNYITKVGDYTYLSPNFDNIPNELKQLDRWVTWKAVKLSDKDKPTKIPYDPKYPESTAKANSPDTWATFEEAVTAFEEGGRTGIGIVLNGDGLVGVDLDNCVNNGVITDPAKAILNELNPQYVEISPSGTGIRALGYAEALPKGINGVLNGVQVELYSNGRYLTLTGKTLRNNGLFNMPGFASIANKVRPTSNIVQEQAYGQHFIDINRNNYLFQYASKLRRNIHDLNLLYQAVMAENLRICQPPLSEQEIKATIMQTVAKYTPEEIELKSSPIDDFQIDMETGELVPIVKVNPWISRIREISKKVVPPNWLIDGILADKMTIIAGSPGVGKTSCLVPLAMVVAGFQSHLSNVTAKYNRKVLYVTEDKWQIDSIIHGIIKHLVLPNGNKVTYEMIAERFIVIETMKSKVNDLILLEEVARDYIEPFKAVSGAIDMKPLIVLDTSSATFLLDDENNNSEVSKYVAALKENFINHDYPLWIVAHTSKINKRSEVAALSVRGAGAFEGDANCIAYLVQEENVNTRYFVLGKHRYSAKYNEIAINSVMHQEIANNKYGDIEEVYYRYSILEQTTETARITAKLEAKERAEESKEAMYKQRILEKLAELGPVSPSQLAEQSIGKKTTNLEYISEMIDVGKIIALPGKNGGKLLTLPNKNGN